MADPVFTPAVVGAVVSELLKAVIDAAKGAIRIKANCKILKATVDTIRPLLKEAAENSADWSEAHSGWLTQFNDLLEEAKTIAEECIQESRYDRWTRLIKAWQWRKLPSRLMDINCRIEEARKNTDFVILGVVKSMNSGPKVTKSEVDFVIQATPSVIVGVEERFNKVKRSVVASHAKDKPSYLGLHGRGGAGKTLLAQKLNNDKDIQALYGARSILWITVGLDARVSDLYKTMGVFVNDGVYEREYAHRNQEDQRTYFRNALAKKKVLLILDDVWDKQCDGHDMMYWLDVARAPGSATLITTRSMSVLVRVHAEAEVVLELSDEESWKLFCSHAFGSDSRPSTISEELARNVCKECKGLPLALKVIGSAMLDKVDQREWRSALHDLRQSRPILDSNVDDELFGRLWLSYKELKNDVTKTCFLYFAAFPEDYEIPISQMVDMWIAEGLFDTVEDGDNDDNDRAMVHLEILAKRSLIDWNHKQDYVKVHDILRDLALYIIDKAKPGECAHECFFQLGKVFKSFPTRKLVQEVKRMSLSFSSISQWPENLQAPHVEVCLLVGVYDNNNTTPEYFFSNMRRLKYLDLSANYVSFEGKLPSFKGLIYLTHLNLKECSLLKELPESIGGLTSLTYLNLEGCNSLKNLPKSIGQLKRLTYLNLRGCESLEELRVSIGELSCLTFLDIQRCVSLNKLLKSVGELKCLTHLNLNGCKFLKELPESIGQLWCLPSLDVQRCTSLSKLPKSIGELKCLTHLYLNGCRSLEELPESISQLSCLTFLDIQMCVSLSKLPESIGELKCLISLDLFGCQSLKKLPDSIGMLKCLVYLDLGGCESLKELPESIGKLKCLEHLDFGRCKSLEELPESIGQLSCLIFRA